MIPSAKCNDNRSLIIWIYEQPSVFSTEHHRGNKAYPRQGMKHVCEQVNPAFIALAAFTAIANTCTSSSRLSEHPCVRGDRSGALGCDASITAIIQGLDL